MADLQLGWDPERTASVPLDAFAVPGAYGPDDEREEAGSAPARVLRLALLLTVVACAAAVLTV